MSDVQLAPTPAPTSRQPEIVHLVCCIDIDRAFCGTDRTGEAFTTRDITCVVCIDIKDNATGCPFGHPCEGAHT